MEGAGEGGVGEGGVGEIWTDTYGTRNRDRQYVYMCYVHVHGVSTKVYTCGLNAVESF